MVKSMHAERGHGSYCACVVQILAAITVASPCRALVPHGIDGNPLARFKATVLSNFGKSRFELGEKAEEDHLKCV